MAMKFRVVVLVLAMLAPNGISAQSSTPEAYDGPMETIQVEITASGSRTAQKLDDSTCKFGFPGLVENPTLDVLTKGEVMVATVPLGVGDWSMPADTAYCKARLEVEVPSDQEVRIDIAPYFSETFSDVSLKSGEITIDLHREEGDPFPISPIPSGGPMEGTDEVRIIGELELVGENYDDFMTSPFGCMGMGGYRDIAPGMQITVKDETGTIIGLAELLPDPIEDMPVTCKFYFVAEVPVSSFYSFESGRRGSITVSHDDLENDDWSVSLILGR